MGVLAQSKRKDIERAFGVLKRKLHFLVRPLERLYVEEIATIVYSCIIIHNMAVGERIAADDNVVESADFYECVEEKSSMATDVNDSVNNEAESAARRYVARGKSWLTVDSSKLVD